MSDLLLICCSKKPPLDQPHVKSATRELLRLTASGLEDAGVPFGWLDMRDLNLPWFEGQPLQSYPDEALHNAAQQVTRARAVVLSMPAYWGGLAGVSKNLLDLLGGAAYDQADRRTPFSRTFVAPVIVGGATGDSAAGLLQFRHTLGEMGAMCLPMQVSVDNPREATTMETTVQQAYQLGVRVARTAGLLKPVSAGTVT